MVSDIHLDGSFESLGVLSPWEIFQPRICSHYGSMVAWYIYLHLQYVGKYTSLMDPMGFGVMQVFLGGPGS